MTEENAELLVKQFLLCFLMDQRFFGEIETDNFTVLTMKIRSFDFHYLGLLSPIFYELSAKSLAQKV